MTDRSAQPDPRLIESNLALDYLIPWQWWSGDDYLAGFRTRADAETYGRERGWTK